MKDIQEKIEAQEREEEAVAQGKPIPPRVQIQNDMHQRSIMSTGSMGSTSRSQLRQKWGQRQQSKNRENADGKQRSGSKEPVKFDKKKLSPREGQNNPNPGHQATG